MNLQAKATSKKGVVVSQSQAVAPDPAATPGDIEILAPEADYTVYVAGSTAAPGTEVVVDLRASEFEWGCTWSGFSDGLPAGLRAVNCRDVDKLPNNVNDQPGRRPRGCALPERDDTPTPLIFLAARPSATTP